MIIIFITTLMDETLAEPLKGEMDRVIERHRIREPERARPLEIADTLLRIFDRALRDIAVPRAVRPGRLFTYKSKHDKTFL